MTMPYKNVLVNFTQFGLYLEKIFPKFEICARTQQILLNFQYRTNSVKLNDKIFLALNLKNPLFGLLLTHFPSFGGKKKFSKKSSCHKQLHKGL